MRYNNSSTAVVLLIASTMMLAPMSALATHNSVGKHVSIAIADEVDSEGNLVPDIPAEPDNPLRFRYHQNLEDSIGEARIGPPDQTGDRYNPDTDGCEAYGDGTQYADDAAYETDLKEGDACYVGFMDHQWEYLFTTTLFLVKQGNDGIFYPFNPPSDDGHCQGEDPEPVTGQEDVDKAIARAERGPVDGFLLGEGDCQGSGHTWFFDGWTQIDINLFNVGDETEPIRGDGAGAMADPGSGYNTLPPLITPHIFLFGQPHPDTADEDRTNLPASDSIYELAFPQTDNPCGERTKVCELLSPQDIINYDDNFDNLAEDVGGFGQQARVCTFKPQFTIINPDGRSAGLCGVFGNVVNQFMGTTQAGGLGLDDVSGGAPTWLNTLPGWYRGVISITGGEADDAAFMPTEFTRLIGNTDGEYTHGAVVYATVNPKVPGPDESLWCVRPNFLSAGDDTLLPEGISDPGVYGDYIAHAMDTDVFTLSGRNQYDALLSHKDTVRNGVGAGEPIPDSVDPDGPGGLDPVPVDENGDDQIGLHDVESIVFHANNATDVEEVSLPPQIGEAVDRLDYTEGANDDSDPVTPNDTAPADEVYTQTLPEGFQCDFNGVVSLQEETTLDGGLQFLMSPFVYTTWIKDPTVRDESELPARESETQRNGWQVEIYDFSGSITARTDSNQNFEFDGCATANGQPQPDNDLCPWRALWDAYNDDCTNIAGQVCGEILEGLGYDLDAGVGLYSVIKNDGPTVVRDEGASLGEYTSGSAVQVLGEDDTTATNCVIGISIGFKDKLIDNLGVADEDALVDELCWDGVPDERVGEHLVIEDAFSDQSGVSPGSFGSNVEFGKVLATPDGTDELTPHEGFTICVHGVWNVADDPGTPEVEVSADTEGNLDLTGQNTFGDCDTFDDA